MPLAETFNVYVDGEFETVVLVVVVVVVVVSTVLAVEFSEVVVVLVVEVGVGVLVGAVTGDVETVIDPFNVCVTVPLEA